MTLLAQAKIANQLTRVWIMPQAKEHKMNEVFNFKIGRASVNNVHRLLRRNLFIN